MPEPLRYAWGENGAEPIRYRPVSGLPEVKAFYRDYYASGPAFGGTLWYCTLRKAGNGHLFPLETFDSITPESWAYGELTATEYRAAVAADNDAGPEIAYGEFNPDFLYTLGVTNLDKNAAVVEVGRLLPDPQNPGGYLLTGVTPGDQFGPQGWRFTIFAGDVHAADVADELVLALGNIDGPYQVGPVKAFTGLAAESVYTAFARDSECEIDPLRVVFTTLPGDPPDPVNVKTPPAPVWEIVCGTPGGVIRQREVIAQSELWEETIGVPFLHIIDTGYIDSGGVLTRPDRIEVTVLYQSLVHPVDGDYGHTVRYAGVDSDADAIAPATFSLRVNRNDPGDRPVIYQPEFPYSGEIILDSVEPESEGSDFDIYTYHATERISIPAYYDLRHGLTLDSPTGSPAGDLTVPEGFTRTISVNSIYFGPFGDANHFNYVPGPLGSDYSWSSRSKRTSARWNKKCSAYRKPTPDQPDKQPCREGWYNADTGVFLGEQSAVNEVLRLIDGGCYRYHLCDDNGLGEFYRSIGINELVQCRNGDRLDAGYSFDVSGINIIGGVEYSLEDVYPVSIRIDISGGGYSAPPIYINPFGFGLGKQKAGP